MINANDLNIGDTSGNGQVTIIDEDRLCYLVKSTSRGAIGLRTISKALLKEFVAFIDKHPEVPANEVRFKISGQSDIDKYEYGYGATISVMAKMILGQERILRTTGEKKKTHAHPFQQIFYGAPGTGKSHKVKEVTDKLPKSDVFRTTFHPDSDYSTFIGCYKPTKEKPTSAKQPIWDYDILVDKFKEYLKANENITNACTLFGYDYHDSIIEIQNNGKKIADLVNDAHKSQSSYDSVVRAGMSCYESHPNSNRTNSITYEFVPQAFINAYVRAYHTEEPVFLVIEEINRGNCAQIFGDMFQLLDRNCESGESDYAIKPDSDLQNYLSSVMADARTDKEEIKSGEEMCLPSNLHIWATMNTSDQSLFPIDSAFKRRWDWKYMPIDYEKEKWSIVAKGVQYSWSDFLKKMNNLVASATDSEDKMLGFYFAKAKKGIIDADTFVGKVVFYLWNDVFKDYGLPKEILNGVESKEFAFRNFFMVDGRANEDMVKRLLDNLGVAKPVETGSPVEDTEHQDEA